MYNAMLDRQKYLISEISKCRQIINGAPSGKLVCTRNGGYVKWYVRDNEKFYYLPKKDRIIAELLAKKNLFQTKLSLLQKELTAVENYLATCTHDDEYAKAICNESISDIPFSIFLPQIDEDSKKWVEAPYKKSTLFPERLTRKCVSGNIVRSKSEMMIDSELYSLGIPFRYECELIIDEKTYYPDFTIYKAKTHEIRYWEHLGNMDDPAYVRKNCQKLEEYSLNGIYPGVNLYLTYETGTHQIDISKIHSTALEIKEWIES